MEKTNFKLGLIYCITSSIAIPLLVLLIIFSSLYGNAYDIVSFTLFGSSLFLLFLFNTLYYWIKNKTASKVFLRFIHILSFAFLASSYTCICLGPLLGAWGWSIWGVVLGLSILGIIFSSIWHNIPDVILIISYTLISSILFVAIKPLMHIFSNLSLLGLLLFIISFLLFLISGIIKISKLEKLNILSHILSILGCYSTYLFIINFLLFI